MNTISETNFHIGNRVVAARQLRGISQETLAQKLDVTPQQIEEYEQGRTLLTAGLLYDAARALEVGVSFFYEGLDDVSCCPYSLSDERFALLRSTIQRIAADHDGKKLLRNEMITAARQLCEVLGWNYGSGRSNSDRPPVVPAVAAE